MLTAGQWGINKTTSWSRAAPVGAGLTVTDYDSLMTGSSSGPVVVPGDPDGSRIVEVLQGSHYAQLSAPELDVLIEWITNGAAEEE